MMLEAAAARRALDRMKAPLSSRNAQEFARYVIDFIIDEAGEHLVARDLSSAVACELCERIVDQDFVDERRQVCPSCAEPPHPHDVLGDRGAP